MKEKPILAAIIAAIAVVVAACIANSDKIARLFSSRPEPPETRHKSVAQPVSVSGDTTFNANNNNNSNINQINQPK